MAVCNKKTDIIPGMRVGKCTTGLWSTHRRADLHPSYPDTCMKSTPRSRGAKAKIQRIQRQIRVERKKRKAVQLSTFSIYFFKEKKTVYYHMHRAYIWENSAMSNSKGWSELELIYSILTRDLWDNIKRTTFSIKVV